MKKKINAQKNLGCFKANIRWFVVIFAAVLLWATHALTNKETTIFCRTANLVSTVDAVNMTTFQAPKDPAFEAAGLKDLTDYGPSTTLQDQDVEGMEIFSNARTDITNNFNNGQIL